MSAPQYPSNFAFLVNVRPELAKLCIQAERVALMDPDYAAILARRTAEKLVRHAWTISQIGNPRDADFFSLLNDPRFSQLAGSSIVSAFHAIRQTGNKAAHSGGVHHSRGLHL